MSASDTLHITEIVGCARCDGNHEHLAARAMARPFAPAEAGGLVWTHWASCPTNGDPVLVMATANEGRHEPLPTYVKPIAMPVPGPGMPRYRPTGLGAVWLILAGVIVITVFAILCGALWR